MLDFEFYAPTRIIFGESAMDALPEQLKKAGATKILLVSSGGGGSKKAVEDTRAAIEKTGVPHVEFTGIKPNPLLSKVVAGVDFCKKEKVIVVNRLDFTESAN
ncbi:MAG: iron-containing alcohol dehydrogenase [Clostridiales Family XIII bacterium]|jgi:alcohol dehydrogenase YqhD (iron-dependent ADH family)|nr:iron-containing alcohol dehydrogenase [Clostridiales Family XIII bacterium]